MDEFLQDRGFLQELNKYRVKTYYASIRLLDFETERTIAFIQGKIVSGSMSITGNSPTRRTGSLQIVFDRETFDLTNVDNLIAINKKFSLTIEIKNPFYEQGTGNEYFKYGDKLAFPQGLFLITSANSSISTTSRTITLQFIDKMGMLNGVCGGTIPAAVSLHDRITIDAEDNVTTTYPLIRQIIQEVVHHFGNEHPSRIIINDVPSFGRQVVRWNGASPIRFAPDDGAFIVAAADNTAFPKVFYRGEDIGYMSTDLTYPGELVMKAGTTVTQVLDEIVKTLGNFEYFYDVDGFFYFQQIRNFDKTGQTPAVPGNNNKSTNTPFNISNDPVAEAKFRDNYIPKFSSDQFLNEFADASLVSSVSFNPQYANIKNDFVVWGSRKESKDNAKLVRYHLAIDERPKDTGNNPRTLCSKFFWEYRDITSKLVLRYVATDTNAAPSVDPLKETVKLHSTALKIGMPFEWREELYRRALLAFNTSTEGSYYDEELMAEWRLIYDPSSEDFERRWKEHYGTDVSSVPWNGYNIDVIVSPQNIRYWLDLIDTATPLGAYSVNRIGRRSIVKENNKINEVLAKEVPDIVFIDDSDSDRTKAIQAMKDYISIGQTYCLVQPEFIPSFQYRNSFGSCYEDVRELMYLNLIYNAQVSMQTIPIFYLDVNKVIRLNFPDLGISGNFVISQISWNLGNTATMQISATEAVVIA